MTPASDVPPARVPIARDRWAEWLLEKRFGGNQEVAARMMNMLHGVRDRVLRAAAIQPGDTVLDVGTGDGLIAFGALDRVGDGGRVIFVDISRPLLDHARQIALDLGVLDRCDFIEAPADDLAMLGDASVNVVTTRSVLIYVKDKAAAFREFHRVLKPGGRIAIWEPINSFAAKHTPPGHGVAPEVLDLGLRVRDFYRALQPDDDPMLDFDEMDLVRLCEEAGFRNVRLDLTITVTPAPAVPWEIATNAAGNPNIPSLREAMQQIFTPDERARFERYQRPIVEAGGTQTRAAVALLRATKDGGAPMSEVTDDD